MTRPITRLNTLLGIIKLLCMRLELWFRCYPWNCLPENNLYSFNQYLSYSNHQFLEILSSKCSTNNWPRTLNPYCYLVALKNSARLLQLWRVKFICLASIPLQTSIPSMHSLSPTPFISKNNTMRSVHSVHLTHLTLERKSRTRTQPPYHTTHLTQPDAAPNPQDAPDAAPNTQDATWRQTTSSRDKRRVPPLLFSDLGHNRFKFHTVKPFNLLLVVFYCSNIQANSLA